MSDEIKPSQIVSPEVAKAHGIPVPSDAESVALYGFTVEDKRPDRSKAKEYGSFECILDRVLIRSIVQDNVEGFGMSEKYRMHSNWGEVIAIGDSVVLGGERIPLSEFVQVGDLVKYGEHTAESFDTNDSTLYIVRVQDLRGRRKLK